MRAVGLAVVTVVLAVVTASAAADIVGNWVGQVESEQGAMQIKLTVVEEKGKLSGKLATGHGEWEVVSIEEKTGTWTVTFTHEGGTGQLSGRIEGDRFAGTWDNGPNRKGPFDLRRSKK